MSLQLPDAKYVVRPAVPACAVFSAPHIFTYRWSTANIMWLVSASLFPVALWSIWLYGWPALRVLALTILSCVATEAALNFLSCRPNPLYRNRRRVSNWTIDDGSAVLSGLLLGMNLSAAVVWYIPVLGGIFAMLVAKWSFGGLGCNWVNPALAGRAFVFFSFGSKIQYWPPPSHVLQNNALQNFEAITAATPLSLFRHNLSGGSAMQPGASTMQQWGEQMGLSPHDSFWNLFLGFQSGSIGEGATLLLLLGGLFLLALRIIRWQIPLTFLGSFALLTWIFGGYYHGLGPFRGEVLFHVYSGGLMLGAWFMATDYSSCPKMPWGKFIFGLGCGVLTFLIRFYGSYPEGVMLAILFMNIWTPTLDLLWQPRIFGSGKKGAQSCHRKNRRTKRLLKQVGY